MKVKKRSEAFYCRVSPELLQLITLMQSAFSGNKLHSKSDLLQQAICNFARTRYYGNRLNEILALCDQLEETRNVSDVRKGEKYRKKLEVQRLKEQLKINTKK